ncbi:MAG: CPBP family intramembrane metalloprotease [Cyclobacteriaceae bacterium]
MRKILTYLKDYQSKHFDLKVYLTTALFLLVTFIFNYTLDFEDSIIDENYGSFGHWLRMFLWMMMPYVVVSWIMVWFKKVDGLGKDYWIKVLIGFAVLSLSRTFNLHHELFEALPYIEQRFFSRSFSWVSKVILIVIPLFMFYAIYENEKPKDWFGLSTRNIDLKPYFILLALAVIFIAIGSFIGDLKNYYPRYQFTLGGKLAENHGFPEILPVIFFELCYGSSFISVEVFFRGFLIYAFVKSLGGYAVLPMVVTYAFLHFGKPMAEAISSIFGGYILGIVAYHTRNVWGGIIIHLGVAWAMELFGYLQGLL